MSVADIDGQIPAEFPLTVNAVLIPTFAAIGIIINIVPARLLAQVKNLPAVTLVITNMVTNLWSFLNGVIWPTEDWSRWWNGVGFCDIQVILQTPLYTLYVLATCLLMRDLARAVDVDNPCLFETPARRRRRLILDVLCIFGPPIIQLPLHYVVQPSRFGISPIYGCVDILDNSWPEIVLLSMWPLLIGILSCYYACKSFLYHSCPD